MKKLGKIFDCVAQTASEATNKEEWIWIEGFKGTDKDMKCNGYQYELGKQHDMPEDEKIEECVSGFHLCKKLDDVFAYYEIGDGRRFFKVKALVRKKDWDIEYMSHSDFFPSMRKTKYVAKSIIFERELTPDELIIDRTISSSKVRDNWTFDRKIEALEAGINVVERRIQSDILTDLGYSREFSNYLVCTNRFHLARALGTQKDISMDTRVNRILERCDDEFIRSI